eukprot:236692_1
MSYGYHAVVNRLQNYVNSNQTFAIQLNQTFVEANSSNITFTEMYQFFDLWIVKAPNTSSMLYGKYYQYDNYFSSILYKFAVYTPTGSIIFSSHVGQEWFQSYLNAVKRFCDSPNSTNVIQGWKARPDINMTEYIIPQNGYQSFNEFFAREIKSEYRPIASPTNDSVITSPCDGQVVEIVYNLSMNENYTIKDINYSLSAMFMNDFYANEFGGGTLIQIYLRTKNYHRFHCSVSGNVTHVDNIGGFQFWHPEGINYHTDGYYKWLANNCRRGMLYVDTGIFGLVAHNYVGVWLVNSVNIHIDAGIKITKGDETGFFKYGGSTIAVLFQKHALDHVVVKNQQYINYGEPIAIANMNYNTQTIKKMEL